MNDPDILSKILNDMTPNYLNSISNVSKMFSSVNKNYKKSKILGYFLEHVNNIVLPQRIPREKDKLTKSILLFLMETNSGIAGSSMICSFAGIQSNTLFTTQCLKKLENMKKLRHNSDIDIWVPYPTDFVNSMTKQFKLSKTMENGNKFALLWLDTIVRNCFPYKKQCKILSTTNICDKREEYKRLHEYIVGMTSLRFRTERIHAERIQFMLLSPGVTLENVVKSFDIIGVQFLLRSPKLSENVKNYNDYVHNYLDVSDNNKALRDLMDMKLNISDVAIVKQSSVEWLRTLGRIYKYKYYGWDIKALNFEDIKKHVMELILKEESYHLTIPVENTISNISMGGGSAMTISKFMKRWNRHIENIFPKKENKSKMLQKKDFVKFVRSQNELKNSIITIKSTSYNKDNENKQKI